MNNQENELKPKTSTGRTIATVIAVFIAGYVCVNALSWLADLMDFMRRQGWR
jgi:hypothetical protein